MNTISWVFLFVMGMEQGVIRLAPNSTLRSLTLPSPPFAEAQGVASPLPTTPPGDCRFWGFCLLGGLRWWPWINSPTVVSLTWVMVYKKRGVASMMLDWQASWIESALL